MPKLHDQCQILLEELRDRTRTLGSDPARVFALTLALHVLEEDLADRHPDAMTISSHLWQVFESCVAPRFPASAFRSADTPPIPEDDPGLGGFLQSALWEGRRFFPYKKAII